MNFTHFCISAINIWTNNMQFDIQKFCYLPELVHQDGIRIQSVEHPMDLMFSLRLDHLQAGNKSSQQNHEHFIISRINKSWCTTWQRLLSYRQIVDYLSQIIHINDCHYLYVRNLVELMVWIDTLSFSFIKKT